jgi:hypothetical protein
MGRFLPLEFDLHVLKKRGAVGRPDHFTIAVWDGLLTLRSVCHVLPIEEALVALREILETAGRAPAEDGGKENNREPRASSDRR